MLIWNIEQYAMYVVLYMSYNVINMFIICTVVGLG